MVANNIQVTQFTWKSVMSWKTMQGEQVGHSKRFLFTLVPSSWECLHGSLRLFWSLVFVYAEGPISNDPDRWIRQAQDQTSLIVSHKQTACQNITKHSNCHWRTLQILWKILCFFFFFFYISHSRIYFYCIVTLLGKFSVPATVCSVSVISTLWITQDGHTRKSSSVIMAVKCWGKWDQSFGHGLDKLTVHTTKTIINPNTSQPTTKLLTFHV